MKKVPVTANYGDSIFGESVIGMDYTDCSKQTLSRIGFRLSNIYGEPSNLHGDRRSLFNSLFPNSGDSVAFVAELSI